MEVRKQVDIKSKVSKLKADVKKSAFFNKLNKMYKTIDEQNINFLDSIAYRDTPQIESLYYIHANQYWTVMQIHDIPPMLSKNYFDCFLHNDNIIIMIDETPITNREAKEFLGTRIDKENEGLEVKSSFLDVMNGKEKLQSKADFVDYLTQTGDSVKSCTIRFYLHERSLEKLQDLIESVEDALKDREMRGYIQTNNLDDDLKAISKMDNPAKVMIPSKGMSNLTMASGISVVDEYVSCIGYTNTGVYAPDFMSYKNGSFCIGVLGKQGSGKSSFIKSLNEDAILRDEQVFMFDLHNKEYEGLANRYDIPSVSFDRAKYINPYQIFNVADKNGIITDKDISVIVALNSNIYKLQSGVGNDEVILQYRQHLNSMYEVYKGKNINDIKDADWFTVDDVIKYVDKKEKNNEYEEYEIKDIYLMRLGLNDMVKTYGYLFNHTTNISLDLTKSIRFDVSFLTEIKDEKVTSAYMSLLLNYTSKAITYNETLNDELEKELDYKPVRPQKPLIVDFEEAGTLMKYDVVCDQIDIMMRQTRKGRTSFIFPFHTINDIETGNKGNKEKVKSIFGLCSHFIIGEIDGKTAEVLPEYIKGLTKDDAMTAHEFRKGSNGERSFISCNDRMEKIMFRTIVSEEQQKYFGGGK